MKYQFKCGYVCDPSELTFGKSTGVICPKDRCRLVARIVKCVVCGEEYTTYKLAGVPSAKCEKCRDYYTIFEVSELLDIEKEKIQNFIKDGVIKLSDNNLIWKREYQRFVKNSKHLLTNGNKSNNEKTCIREDCVYYLTCNKNVKRCNDYEIDFDFWVNTQKNKSDYYHEMEVNY